MPPPPSCAPGARSRTIFMSAALGFTVGHHDDGGSQARRPAARRPRAARRRRRRPRTAPARRRAAGSAAGREDRAVTHGALLPRPRPRRAEARASRRPASAPPRPGRPRCARAVRAVVDVEAHRRGAGADRGDARNRRARRRDRRRASGCTCRCCSRRRRRLPGYAPSANVSTLEPVDPDPAGRALDLDARRASSCSRRPPILIADTMGGICSLVTDEARRGRRDLLARERASRRGRAPRPTRRGCRSRRRTRPSRGTSSTSPAGTGATASRGRARRAARRSRRDRACPHDRRGAGRRCAAAAPTTSCDVHPAGLSTTTNPSTVTASEQALDASTVSGIGSSVEKPGGETVAAAALRLRDPADVDGAERTQAHAREPSVPSLSTTATSASLVRRTTSMSPSTSSNVTP